MPTLTEIYRKNSKYVRRSGFTVEVCESMPYVSIEDEDEEGFFLQGDDAEKYIAESRKIWTKCRILSLDDAFYGHAKQFIDCL